MTFTETEAKTLRAVAGLEERRRHPTPDAVAEAAALDLFDAQDAALELIRRGCLTYGDGRWWTTALGASEARTLDKQQEAAGQEALEVGDDAA